MDKFGFVVLVGAPNAGKSTLINNLVKSKVSITSPKIQTTRSRVLGITVWDQTQVVFIDTPGVFKPRKRFDRAMVQSVWESVKGADKILFIVDVEEKYSEIINESQYFQKKNDGESPDGCELRGSCFFNRRCASITFLKKVLVRASRSFSENFSFQRCL